MASYIFCVGSEEDVPGCDVDVSVGIFNVAIPLKL